MRNFGGTAFFLIGVLYCAITGSVYADQRWNLTTSDFQKRAIELTDISSQSITIVGPGGKAVPISISRVLRLDRGGSATEGKSVFLLTLQNGDRFFGQPGDMSNEIISWQNPVIGALKFPLSNLRSISRKDKATRPVNETAEDQVHLSNKDMVRGAVTGIENNVISVQVGGDISSVPLSGVDSIAFSSVKKAPLTTRYWKLMLTDGSVLTADELKSQGDSLIFTLLAAAKITDRKNESASLTILQSQVLSIEQFNGPISWLSDREPKVNVHTPFSSETVLPGRMNLNVFGKPIRFGSDTFDKGIGVHANSTMTFPLDGSYKIFRTRYAIDSNGETGKAAVHVQILLDGKVVHETNDFRSFKISPVISVDLNNAKELTLMVTAAGLTDAQDRLNWIDCALVKEKNESPPPLPTAPEPPRVVPPTSIPTSKPVATPATNKSIPN